MLKTRSFKPFYFLNIKICGLIFYYFNIISYYSTFFDLFYDIAFEKALLTKKFAKTIYKFLMLWYNN